MPLAENNLDWPHVVIAETFARALIGKAWSKAHDMLSDELRASISSTRLEEEFALMTSYDGKIDTDSLAGSVCAESHLEQWPGKRTNDIGWAYVSILGEHYHEGISVVVAREGDRNFVREIVWGRP